MNFNFLCCGCCRKSIFRELLQKDYSSPRARNFISRTRIKNSFSCSENEFLMRVQHKIFRRRREKALGLSPKAFDIANVPACMYLCQVYHQKVRYILFRKYNDYQSFESMPDFLYKGKVYYNPVQLVMEQIGGVWKAPILWRLRDKTLRYSELRKDITHITDKMLTSQLRELEEDGYIQRKVYAVVPPKTEYSLTEKGRDILELITVIRDYGLKMIEEYKKEGE